MIDLLDKDRRVLNPERLKEMDVYTIITNGSTALELINEGDAFVNVKRAGSTKELQVPRKGGRIILHHEDSVTLADPRDHEKKHEYTVDIY